MELRKADICDVPAVMYVIRSCIEQMEMLGIQQWDEIYPDTATVTNDIERQELFVLEQESKITGIVVLNEHQEPEYHEVSWEFAGKALVVHRLAVHPSYQGRGYAQELMRFAYTYARKHQYAAIRLDAFSRNPAAISLYDRIGYRRAGSVEFRKGRFFCFEIRLNERGL